MILDISGLVDKGIYQPVTISGPIIKTMSISSAIVMFYPVFICTLTYSRHSSVMVEPQTETWHNTAAHSLTSPTGIGGRIDKNSKIRGLR